MESAPRRRLRADGRLLRQYEAALWHHLAPRCVHREPKKEAPDRRCGPRSARRGRDGAAAWRGRARRPGTLGFYERRVQALRRGAVPAGMPDRQRLRHVLGVITQVPHDGRAFKCTLCYDRQRDGLEPACAKACPTNSIMFGEVEELKAIAE